jgi:penicillin-binding protein 2
LALSKIGFAEVAMFTIQTRRIAGWLALLVMLVGCSALPEINTGGAASDDEGGGVGLQIRQTPEQVVGAFVEAWNSANYPAMYALLHSESQTLYSQPVFQTNYETVASDIELTGVSASVGTAQMQGMTAIVPYDLQVTSRSFGTIEDAGRKIRLIDTPAGWRIAWTTMDIFDGLAAGARLEVGYSPPTRGSIYDRSGNVLVESDGIVTEVYAQRQSMFDEVQCAYVLGRLLRIDPQELLTRFAQYNPETIFFVSDADAEALNSSTDLNDICGINRDGGLIQQRTDRRYVGHGAAVHVTGYIGQATEADLQAEGYRPGDLIGQVGIEAAFEQELRGRASLLLQITEPGGSIIREIAGTEGEPSQNVWLTLDRDLQLAAAQALHDAYSYAEINWASRSPGGSAVVIDVNSGAILALASYPTFDPSLFSPNTPFPFPGAYIAELLSDAQGAFFNRATQGQYAPGSVFKIITTAAAANEGLMQPDEQFYCDLQWDNGPQYGDTLPVRLDWRASEPEEFRFPTGYVTISSALTSSCDPFFYEMGARLFQRSPNLLSNYARRFGLGRTYGLDAIMPEAAGVIPTTDAVEEAINEAIGQGDVALPPLQMAVAVAAVANGGTIYRPYIVQQVGREGEAMTFTAQPEMLSQVDISPEALALTRQGMCDVTTYTARNTTNGEPLGTAAGVFENTFYSICGKTGTAQTDREPNAWFVAYVPADNPQIALVVMSQNSREGSEVAAPILRRILDDYLNVPEDYFAAFPDWWQEDYVPLTIAAGGTGGG